jgi:carbamoyl-phosphate synthase large subunit
MNVPFFDRFVGRTPGERGRRMRMLLSSAGRRVGLLRAFRSSAEDLGIQLEIFACDLEPEWSSACREADYAFAVPRATSPDYIETVRGFCERHDIALVVPTIDTELVQYSHARERFSAIGTTVSIGSPAIVEMARDKLATARFLSGAGIASPRTASAEWFLASDEEWPWPLMAKPRHGSSSRGIQTIHNRDELLPLAAIEPYVVQEMLRGREFTVNLYFDEQGRLQTAIPHERLRVRAGEVEKAVTTRDPVLCGMARDLGAALDGPFGAMCFQAIMDADGRASLFEINARFGGGYPLAHQAGATFTRWLLEQVLDLPRSAHEDWRPGVVMLRFDDAVFV